MASRDSAWNPLQWARDLMGVWQDTRLIVLTAQIAAVYAAILIPFKVGIPLIPGFAELRPANAIPIVASLLFGPAAAWGAGIGNIIGDCFGTLGPASVFGFLGNFLFGYVPYLLWGQLGFLSSGKEPVVRSWWQGCEYGLICVVASGVCAGVIAWGVELLGFLPFAILAPAIFFNNVVMGMMLGPPLLKFLYPRVKRWGLLYADLKPGLGSAYHVSKGAEAVALLPEESWSPSSGDPLVNVQNVTFWYGLTGEPVLQNLSFQVRTGETVILMGRSGSGKSTVCFALSGIVPQFYQGSFSGSLHIKGQDSKGQPVWQQAERVGLVFQDFDTQLVSTNVEMEVAQPLEHRMPPMTQTEMAHQISETLRQVGLMGCERRDPLSLSGGQRQRLVVASILVRHPELLVLDQSMTDLDPAGRRDLLALLERLKATGMTVVMAEHEPEDTLHADRILLLEQGQIAWEGAPSQFWGTEGLPEQYGLRPLPIAQCFQGRGLARLPVTVEEAWKMADEHHWAIGNQFQESCEDTSGRSATGETADKNGDMVLELQHVSVGYSTGPLILEDVSFHVRSGEFIAILGKNGAGKSTLAKLLNGLLLPTSGRVFVRGEDTQKATVSQLAGDIGYVFQNPDHQIFAETVSEEVAFGAKNVGCSDQECVQRVDVALSAVGLSVQEHGQADPFSLTKGERQRVAVASVLATQPKVLIFDEPTTGLDGEEAIRMMTMIRELNQRGHTIVMITHAMGLVSEYATRCLVIQERALVGDGPTRTIFANGALLASASLHVPPVIQFAQRWGHTLLTVQEVQSRLVAT